MSTVWPRQYWGRNSPCSESRSVDFEEYYQKFDESGRLDRTSLERLRTADILSRCLPSTPARILDIGGGTGVYAFPLARAGYEVHLIDAVARHIEQAMAISDASSDGKLASCAVGDAKALVFEDRSADAALLLGPLYHLVERSDRVKALREAYRTLRAGGIVFVAAISRFASLIDGVSRNFIADNAFVEIVRTDLVTGQHRNPTQDANYFTTAYFHRPDELRDEMSDAGFSVEGIIGVEGPLWGFRIADWDNEARRELVLGLLRKVETEPSLVGASAHLIGVGRR